MDEAATYVLHPKQMTERLPDKSLVERFRAGGAAGNGMVSARLGDRVEVRRPNV